MEPGGRLYAEQAGRLQEVVEGFRDVPVLVLADLVLDEFLHAGIARVSREAPVLIVEQRRLEAMPGGGANAALNIRSLGGRPLPVGVVGPDDAGRKLTGLLEEAGIDTGGISVLEGYRTPVKTRVMAALAHSRPQQVVRIDQGAAGSVDGRAAAAATRRASDLLGETRALLLSDYAYGVVAPRTCGSLISRARSLGLAVTSDSRHRSRDLAGVTSATPNLEEAEEILGARLGENASGLEGAGRRLLRELQAREVLITRGSRGMILFREGKAPVEIPVFGSDQVSDVTGAGDTVIAAFTLALASGANPLEAALAANAAAGLVVMKQGTATVSPAELASALVRAGSPGAS